MKRLLILGVLLICGGWAGSALAVPPNRSLTFPDGKMGPVVFEGKVHNFGCTECHTKGVFPVMRQGAETITMEKIDSGEQCGVCHNGQRAFATAGNCTRCHKPAEKP